MTAEKRQEWMRRQGIQDWVMFARVVLFWICFVICMWALLCVCLTDLPAMAWVVLTHFFN